MSEFDGATDRQQEEIRQAIKALDEEMKTASANLTTAEAAFKQCQTTYVSRLLEIQERCPHINVTRTAITKTCKDCGVFGVSGV